MYKGYKICVDIHNRLENHCSVAWEVMQKTNNGWDGVVKFIENIDKEISDEEALRFGTSHAQKYIEEKL